MLKLIMRALLPLTLMFLTNNLYAADSDIKIIKTIKENADKCANLHPSNFGVKDCYQKMYAQYDKALSQTYLSLEKKLKNMPKEKKQQGEVALNQLVESQKNWLKFRDSELKLIDNVYGLLNGSMWIPAAEYRKADIVRARLQSLAEFEAHLADTLSEDS